MHATPALQPSAALPGLLCPAESRLILLPAVLRQLKVHILGADEQFRFSLEVLQDILAIIYKQDPVRVHGVHGLARCSVCMYT